jgi:hypothetical protein
MLDLSFQGLSMGMIACHVAHLSLFTLSSTGQRTSGEKMVFILLYIFPLSPLGLTGGAVSGRRDGNTGVVEASLSELEDLINQTGLGVSNGSFKH